MIGRRFGLDGAGRVPCDLAEIRRALSQAADWSPEPLGLDRALIGKGALDQLEDVVTIAARGSGRVVVLAAATPMTVRGSALHEQIAAAIARHSRLSWVVLGPSDGSVHADEQTVAAARAAAAGARCVLTAGSGTISDIGKAVAPAGVPLVAVQTAASVNGYADPFSVLLRAGVKRTTPTRWPDVLIADTDVLLDAPARLNRAGAGDSAAMFTATADWYLASLLGAGGPAFRPEVAGLVRPHGERMLGLGRKLARDAAGLADLARLLTLSGIGMGVTGSTAPASGMEHAVSHLLEMAATATGRTASLHGEQVGVASVVATATWAHVLRVIEDGGLGRPVRLPDPDEVARRIGVAFQRLDPTGAMAAECLADYAVKLRALAAAGDPLGALRAAWPRAGAELARLLVSPAELASGLRAAGLPVRFGDLPAPVPAEEARWAVAHCALQRRRFGVADLAMLLGAWDDEDIGAVLADAERAAEMSGTAASEPSARAVRGAGAP
jgi:glycerol-1-phosphate dehydrogenase [NAD(P)+]